MRNYLKFSNIAVYLSCSFGLINLIFLATARAVPTAPEADSNPSQEDSQTFELTEFSAEFDLSEIENYQLPPQSQNSFDYQISRDFLTVQSTSSEGDEEIEPASAASPAPQVRRIYTKSPVLGIISPTAYGASWGQVGFGFAYVSEQRYNRMDDVGGGVVFGLGDAQKYVGLQVTVGFTNFDDLGDGRLHLKLHRKLTKDMAVAVGVRGLAEWGRESDSGTSVYGVFSNRFRLKESFLEPFSAIYTSIGVGGGQFRSEDDVLDDVASAGVFGSVALRVIPEVNLIADWYGQDLGIGLSFVPFKNIPCSINPSVIDLTGNAGDGSRFLLGVGCGFRF